ncbi:MAG: DNA/RNA nuclease SfsA [Betaproteobacteria bacterium]
MDSGKFFPHTIKGIFTNRPNRFIVECTVDNKPVRAYLPNPGRLWELFFPGSALYLVKHNTSYEGHTDYTVVAVERSGIPIMLHTHVNNLVARKLIERGVISGLEGSAIIRHEVTIGHSRFDFLLKKDGREIIVEIKSCTLVGNSIAMFPDAITVRGTKHLLELASMATQGKDAAVIFLVHWPRVRYFMPEHHTDLEFSRALLSVKDRVLVKAMSVEWEEGLLLGRVRELAIPWKVVEQEARDRGSYIIILRLRTDRRLRIGGLGEVRFRKGYYLYVGSAIANLTQRIGRHRKVIKKHHWHIDYLRAVADFHAALPVRASDNLECEIATALGSAVEWTIPGFGSSDCDCDSHLFGMAEDPVHTRSFIELLQYFRIDRLEKFL